MYNRHTLLFSPTDGFTVKLFQASKPTKIKRSYNINKTGWTVEVSQRLKVCSTSALCCWLAPIWWL